jgi:hypothetical protein
VLYSPHPPSHQPPPPPQRYDQLAKWLTMGRPRAYWMTGFFNPQGFLTAMKQEVNRKHAADKWALDDVVMTSEVGRASRGGCWLITQDTPGLAFSQLGSRNSPKHPYTQPPIHPNTPPHTHTPRSPTPPRSLSP